MTTPKHPARARADRAKHRHRALITLALALAAIAAPAITLGNENTQIIGALTYLLALPALTAVICVNGRELDRLTDYADEVEWHEHQQEQARLNRIAKEMGWQQ